MKQCIRSKLAFYQNNVTNKRKMLFYHEKKNSLNMRWLSNSFTKISFWKRWIQTYWAIWVKQRAHDTEQCTHTTGKKMNNEIPNEIEIFEMLLFKAISACSFAGSRFVELFTTNFFSLFFFSSWKFVIQQICICWRHFTKPENIPWTFQLEYTKWTEKRTVRFSWFLLHLKFNLMLT